MRMKGCGCVQWNPFPVKKIFRQAGLELRTAISVGQYLTHWKYKSAFENLVNLQVPVPLNKAPAYSKH